MFLCVLFIFYYYSYIEYFVKLFSEWKSFSVIETIYLVTELTICKHHDFAIDALVFQS